MEKGMCRGLAPNFCFSLVDEERMQLAGEFAHASRAKVAAGYHHCRPTHFVNDLLGAKASASRHYTFLLRQSRGPRAALAAVLKVR